MLIRQIAFEGKQNFLKGALHCHTTRSDGKGEPGDVIRLHKQNGYDFMALTDHRRYNFENFAPETGMTIIPGMEYDMGLPDQYGFRCFHIVSIGPKEGNGFTQDQRFESAKVADQYEAQPYLDYLHANNNMTIYCHPDWSGTPARYFENMVGNFAMELWNSGCVIENDMDKDAHYWDELLSQGKRIFGVATDDGHAMSHHCHGWVMVNAENNVNSILSALRDGKFYASCGPELYDFTVEGTIVKVKCSPASKIRLVSMCHPTKLATGENLTEATFDLNSWPVTYRYVRVEVEDRDGKKAWSNPIFLDPVMKA